MNQYLLSNKFPAPSDTYEEALDIETKHKEITYEVSAFWGYYLLMIFYLKESETYEKLHDFLDIRLESVTKCVWFLRQKEEVYFYDSLAMINAGEGTEITVEDNFELFCKKVDFIVQQYEDEKFSFEEYCFSGLEMIICHYYGYIPRVNFLKIGDNVN